MRRNCRSHFRGCGESLGERQTRQNCATLSAIAAGGDYSGLSQQCKNAILSNPANAIQGAICTSACNDLYRAEVQCWSRGHTSSLQTTMHERLPGRSGSPSDGALRHCRGSVDCSCHCRARNDALKYPANTYFRMMCTI